MGSKRNWQAISKNLSRHGRQVIAVDVRNHGASAHLPEMTYADMSDDVAQLMRELFIPDADVLGHSMGGKIAMYLALTQPSLVRRLVVEDVSPGVSQEAVESFPAYIAAMKAVEFDQSVPTLAELRRLVDKQLTSAFPEERLRSFILTNLRSRKGVYEWGVNLAAIEANLDLIAGWPRVDATFTKPTFFIAGEKSNRITREGRAERQRLFPNSEETTFVEAGHWVHSDQPLLFMNVLEDFLDS